MAVGGPARSHEALRAVIVNYAFKTYCADQPAAGRWDQGQITRILEGREHRPPYGIEFVEGDYGDIIRNGGVLVLPVGHYHEHEEKHQALRWIWDDLLAMPWGVVIATSDECSTFPWSKIDPWPDHIKLWVTTPRPENDYPPDTRFVGEGAPGGIDKASWALTRDLDLFFSGQGGHERRDRCQDALVDIAFVDPTPNRPIIGKRSVMATFTDGFAQGMSQDNFRFHMSRAWVAPAPSGPCTQDSFRAFEALECGAIPILDGLRPGDRGAGYWEMINMADVAPVIDDWPRLPAVADEILSDRCWWAAKTQAAWQQYKRAYAQRLHADAGFFTGGGGLTDRPRSDLITPIIVTSPIPSHPYMDIMVETVDSVMSRLPDSDILIACDGVRDEQSDRTVDYHTYLWKLCEWTAGRHQVTPFVHREHLHQSGLLRRILPQVRTPFVLFVEHDTPLVGDIPFDDIITEMLTSNLNSMRLLHEASVLPDYEHLFLEWREGAVPWRETLQWSQRPHVARTNWYRQTVRTYFGEDSRTMIEDVMHGVVQHNAGVSVTYTDRKRAADAWNRWRMGVYTPRGDMKRSGHTDGRAGDPKFDMLIAYDGERPDGAPAEGVL